MRKSAVVAIRCTPCPTPGALPGTDDNPLPLPKLEPIGAGEPPKKGRAGAPKSFGDVCSVSRKDSCTLRIELAVECPRMQIVYASMLDVGFTPGGSEIISGGVASSCAGAWAGTAPLPLGPESLSAAKVTSVGTELFVSLTHGTLAVASPLASVDAPECSARLEGSGAAVLGGTLQAIDGPLPLLLQCGCAGGARRVNATLTFRVKEFTSPVVTFVVPCVAGTLGRK